MYFLGVGWGEGHGLDRFGSGQRQVAGSCECGNERSGFMKCGKFLVQFRTRQLLRMYSSTWSQLTKIARYNKTQCFCELLKYLSVKYVLQTTGSVTYIMRYTATDYFDLKPACSELFLNICILQTFKFMKWLSYYKTRILFLTRTFYVCSLIPPFILSWFVNLLKFDVRTKRISVFEKQDCGQRPVWA